MNIPIRIQKINQLLPKLIIVLIIVGGIFYFKEVQGVNLYPVVLSENKNQLSIDYGKCGDFHREVFGTADNTELNISTLTTELIG